MKSDTIRLVAWWVSLVATLVAIAMTIYMLVLKP
jgi:hypothetical protein